MAGEFGIPNLVPRRADPNWYELEARVKYSVRYDKKLDDPEDIIFTLQENPLDQQ